MPAGTEHRKKKKKKKREETKNKEETEVKKAEVTLPKLRCITPPFSITSAVFFNKNKQQG